MCRLALLRAVSQVDPLDSVGRDQTVKRALALMGGLGATPGDMIGLMTEAAIAANFAVPEEAVLITSIGDGFIWLPWFTTVLGDTLGWGGVAILFAFLAALLFFYSRSPRAWERAAGAPLTEEAEAAGPVVRPAAD